MKDKKVVGAQKCCLINQITLLTSKFLTIYLCIINQKNLRKREYTFYTIFNIKEISKEKTRQELHLKRNKKASENMNSKKKTQVKVSADDIINYVGYIFYYALFTTILSSLLQTEKVLKSVFLK